MTIEQRTKVDELVSDFAEMLKPEVDRIEATPATTQDHYGDYGALLSTVSNGDPRTAQLLALALIKCGANRNGVSWALKLFIGK